MVVNDHGRRDPAISSVDNALQVLLLLRSRGQLRVTEVSDHLGVARCCRPTRPRGGKVLLGELPFDRVRVLFAHGLPKITEHTINDLERLRRESEKVRADGYAVNSGESEPGIGALAVPVLVDVEQGRVSSTEQSGDADSNVTIQERAATPGTNDINVSAHRALPPSCP